MIDNLYFNDNLYGGYRNMTFGEIFTDPAKPDDGATADYFTHIYETIGFTNPDIQPQLRNIFYLLYAEFGNSPIASSDATRFTLKLFTIINTEGPIWAKKMEIQSKLFNITEQELEEGSTAIYNTAFNPSTAPTTNTLDELTTINQQNASKHKRGKIEGYAVLVSLLDDKPTRKFLDRFRKLFLTFASPEDALWYATERPNIPINQEDKK